MDQIGKRLLKEGIISEAQLQSALERQKKQGGRLGANLIALNHISEQELQKFLRRYPVLPQTAAETGLDFSFLSDLILKHILSMGEFKIADVVETTKLSSNIVDAVLQSLKQSRFIEVRQGAGYSSVTYTFVLTDTGRNLGRDLTELNRYAGPAPVTLDDYRDMIESQSIKNILIGQEAVKDAFSHLILSESLLARLGPAISSGKAIFLYGPAGNGKTAISETIGALLPETVFIPYSILVGGQIITIFDPEAHTPVEMSGRGEVDKRWIEIKRPLVMSGGELSLKMLDLNFNPITKYYEAAVQMKGNNGIFIVDDFGRQLIDPKHLLNRWIVPLERRVDFVTLHTGMQFSIPFDMLVIFSTNIEPKQLVDEAFLRRIRYKIKIDHPTKDEYEAIFRRVCKTQEIPFNQVVFDHLMSMYRRQDIKLNACHPRDLIDHIVDSAHYHDTASVLTKEGIDYAWQNYFVDM